MLAERPEPLEAASAGAPDVPATPATAVTAVATSTTDPTAHDRLIRPDRSTVHSRDQPGQTLGRPTPAMPRRSSVRGSEGSKPPHPPCVWSGQARHPADDAACKARAVPRSLLVARGQIQRHSLFDECLERPVIDFLAIMNVDRTTGITFEAGVKQARGVLQ